MTRVRSASRRAPASFRMVILGLVPLLAAGDSPPYHWPDSKPAPAAIARAVRLEASVPKRHYRILEPIPLTVKFRNDIPIMVSGTMSEYIHYQLIIKHALPVSPTCYARLFVFGLIEGKGPSICPAGLAGTSRLIPNLVYDMTCIGEYEISVKFSFRLEGDKATYYHVTSAPVKVVVSGEPSFDGKEPEEPEPIPVLPPTP